MSLITINRSSDSLDKLEYNRPKYIYNLCRLYYASNKYVTYCVTNLYFLVGEIKPRQNRRYPSADEIIDTLTVNQEYLENAVRNSKYYINYNNQRNITYDSDHLYEFIADVTKYISYELCYRGSLDSTEFTGHIMNILRKYKLLDSANKIIVK